MTTDTAVSPDARTLWRRGRGFLAAFAVLIASGLLIALFTSGDSGTLHPRSATQTGSRAITELLARHGVDTTLATTAREAAAATGPDSTLLVVAPEALTRGSRATLRAAVADSGARTVLLSPGQATLDAFAPGTRIAEPVSTDTLTPDCAAPEATRAGDARLGGYRYGTDAASAVLAACYPAAGLPTLVTLPADGTAGETVLLGAPEFLYNQHLDEDGNASLALQLLGARDHLVWYLPSPEEAPGSGDEEALTDLLDPGWRWAALQLAIAAGLAALWRGRRLGPVLTERLPVLVRAAETTEGHARLYHQAGARDRAAGALRAAVRTRLAPLVAVPPAEAHAPHTLPAAVATHTGESPEAVHALLFGPPPGDDLALVRLADDLDALERRVAPHTSPKGKDHPS